MTQLRTSITVIALAAALVGCQSTMDRFSKSKPEEEVIHVEPPEPEEKPEDLTYSEYLSMGIQSLQIGEPENARRHIQNALDLNPRSKKAAGLIKQIDADPVQLLGTEYFIYEVRQGESLSSISDEFLGDSLMFYVLARYNDVNNPSELTAGQTLKIPGKEPSVDQTAPSGLPLDYKAQPDMQPQGSLTDQPVTLTSAEIPDTDYSKVRNLYDSGDYFGVIELLEDETIIGNESSELQAMLVQSYSKQSDILIAEGSLEEAHALLEKAVLLEPSNQALQKRLTETRDAFEAQRLYQLGVSEEQAGNLGKAYESFGLVLIYQPDNQAARKKHDDVKNRLVDQYHKDAMLLYRRHELDKAIELWSQVLELDPEHEFASVYRARAIEVKERIDEIGD